MLVQCRVYAFLQGGMQLDWFAFALLLQLLNNVPRQVAVPTTGSRLEWKMHQGLLAARSAVTARLEIPGVASVAKTCLAGRTKLPLELNRWCALSCWRVEDADVCLDLQPIGAATACR